MTEIQVQPSEWNQNLNKINQSRSKQLDIKSQGLWIYDSMCKLCKVMIGENVVKQGHHVLGALL